MARAMLESSSEDTSMSHFTLPALLTTAALAVGCAGTIHTDGYGYYDADIYTPDLLTIAPGVSVVAGYHDPVFYSNNYYWRPDYYGRWYRSPYYDRGWAYYARPPYAVSSIRSPYSYRHYRPYGYTVQRSPYYHGYRGSPGYRGNVRTYDRTYRGSNVRTYDRTYRGSNVRTYDRTYRGSPGNVRTYDRTYRGSNVHRGHSGTYNRGHSGGNYRRR